MLKRIAIGLALIIIPSASCSSTDSSGSATFSCENAKSKCANDPPLSAETCQRLNDPKCGAVFIAFLRCVGDHQTCLPDGTTDESVTERECAAQKNTAIQCAGAIDAGAGG